MEGVTSLDDALVVRDFRAAEPDIERRSAAYGLSFRQANDSTSINGADNYL